ncbi:MAG: hypothetical protein EZS28_003062 [Streblomastix strix]|uniref:Uncharacterized protein n=1 Tax=Streblomastix strix TaxID=222440 RepID=A0A5J4X3R6_9EUKA|nr:MAG: hypothetical protein EZS28_003062 [Streblomastix strix]
MAKDVEEVDGKDDIDRNEARIKYDRNVKTPKRMLLVAYQLKKKKDAKKTEVKNTDVKKEEPKKTGAKSAPKPRKIV